MTSRAEWISLAERVMIASARVPKRQATNFAKILRSNPKYYNQARAKYSITQLSSVSSKDLLTFLVSDLGFGDFGASVLL